MRRHRAVLAGNERVRESIIKGDSRGQGACGEAAVGPGCCWHSGSRRRAATAALLKGLEITLAFLARRLAPDLQPAT